MRNTPLIFAALLLAGCTADAYRADADRQVQALIRDRQAKTTDYNAEVEVEPTTQPTLTRKSYAAVPITQQPEIDGSPIERSTYVLPAGDLGPEIPGDSLLPEVEADIFAEAYRIQRSRLEYGPDIDEAAVIKLDLFGAISYAVRNARTYRNQMESLYLAALDVTLERHLFTPRPFVTTDLRYTDGEAADYQSAYSITQRAGVRQRLPYGGEIVASGLVSFVNALNDNVSDGESAELAIRGSIPLWRGAGMVNLEALIASERELIYATREFEGFRRSFAVDVATRYFNVLIRYNALRNRFTNYRNLLELVERTEALFTAGRVTALEVQRAQQSLLSAEDALNSAQFSLQSDLDDFKIFIGMPVTQGIELAYVDVEVAAISKSLESSEELALKYRLDLQTARDRIEDSKRGADNAANQLGPSLDLSGGASISNQPGNPARDVNRNTLEWDAGLTLDLPVDRLPERNSYRRALIGLEQAKRRAIDLEENVIADVRSAERTIRSAQYSLDIQRAGIDLARERLDFANESLLLGRVTNSREVVEAQSSLLNAQDAYDRARANLQIEMLRYLRDTGTLRVDPDAGILGLAMKREDR